MQLEPGIVVFSNNHHYLTQEGGGKLKLNPMLSTTQDGHLGGGEYETLA